MSAFRDIVVSNSNGLHARPAVVLVELANSFDADIKIQRLEPFEDAPMEANGKSIMEVIMLTAVPGTPLRISADGKDAERAVQSLAELFESHFGEA